MRFDYNACIKEGLLRKVPPSKDKAVRSARAILFFDGYREKSHACIARYLEEKYTKNKLLENRWIELLDHYRELRHGDQYDLSSLPQNRNLKTPSEALLSLLKGWKNYIERLPLKKSHKE